jgi:hypothetical protein
MALPKVGHNVRAYNDNGYQDGTVYYIDDFAFHMTIEEDSFDENQIGENIAIDVRVLNWDTLDGD